MLSERGEKSLKKYSRQRELILTNLQNRCDHPTADMLYMDLKEQMPSIGIATVYRNLVELCKERQISKIVTPNSPDRFDGNLINHLHFVCEKCGNIEDIFLNETEEGVLEDQMELLAKSIGGEKNKAQIMITGICKKCKES